MKSLALNLFQKLLPLLMIWLLLLFVAVAAAVEVDTSSATSITTPTSLPSLATATTSSTITTSSSSAHRIISARNRSPHRQTTTPVPPSLPKPPQLRRRGSISTTTSSSNIVSSSTTTTAASTKSSSTVTAQRQRGLPLARQQQAAAAAIGTTTRRNIDSTTTRRSIDSPTTRRNIVRATTTTAASTKSPTATAQRQRRLPLTRQRQAAAAVGEASSSSSAVIMASTSLKPAIINEASTLASTRLVRHVDATTPQNIRQQRSFQSNAGDLGQSYEDMETKNKQQRRQYARTSSKIVSAESASEPRNQRLRTASDSHNNIAPLSATSLFDSQPSTTSSSLADLNVALPQSGGNLLRGNPKLTTRHNQQTPKTPRMIQRLVAGHIQNAASENHNTTSDYGKGANVETNQYGQQIPAMLSSSYRSHKLNANIRIDAPTTELYSSINRENDYHDDDEALLEDSGDFDNWDNGILRLSAGAGKENALKPKKNKEDTKKTLADQVKDGKYGLIEKEIFRRNPKRPGVLSYLPNKEVPEDNERNYGGLNEEDIWLAEDHLLVIKGGSLNEDNDAEPWPAIDDYNAAGRQIKIPDNPKVPPPFPVQLEENGPVQLIGNNKLTVVYPVPNESLSVYTAGTEAHNASPESDSDDEKNLITRPGKIKVSQENEPGYNYASPSLPWLYNNQTSPDQTSNVGKGKPLNFPMLGPFLYGRNGSLDNATEDFDEDDPSLYYPPPYSFVYKSNYTNAVPPGPLVPGIVVPPPPDHFTKLNKSEKERRPSGQSTPVRYRVYSTSSTTTPPAPVVSTTTTTTITTTESPYRHAVTRITEYTPKIIHIVTPSPRPSYTPNALPAAVSRLQPTPPPTPETQHFEPVRVPVAVPIPIYSVNLEPTARPDVVSFVPTTEPHIDGFSKSNPIYYEYFEAKRQKGSTHVIDDFLASTVKPNPTPSQKPIKLYATSKRPYKNAHHNRNYLQPLAPNHRYVDDNIVVITPKPEVHYKPRPIFKQRPLQNFEQEVNAIRETLRYYQNQELRDNNIPRTPKAKPVFDYNFDASKGVTPEAVRNTFKPPLEYDSEPFQPMVTYSPAVGDENAFKAVDVDKVDAPQGREDVEELNLPKSKYISTTTLVPVQQQQPERSKKLRVGAKYLQPQQQQQQQQNQDYNRWVAVNKQEYNVYTPPETPPSSPNRERYQEPLPPPQRNRDYPAYYYGASRQNNRFYEEPFQNAPNRKIINYRPPPPPSAQQQLPQQPLWSLENDTYVNYAPNRPPLNPDAEFINPYQTLPVNPYQQQQQQQQRLTYQQQQQQVQQQPPPPQALSHQSQYYAPQQQPQRFPGRQYQPQPQPPVSLHRDILVNYRQPLPPINPDSEYISHPQVVRNPAAHQYYRSNAYRFPQQPPIPPPNLNIGGEADVYFLTPKYRRANNVNPNNHNNNPNNRNHAQNGNNGK